MKSIAILFVLAACGSATGPLLPDAEVKTVSSIKITPDTLTAKRGLVAPKQFTATAVLSDNSMVDVTGAATWASSNPSAATVSPSGVVTVVGAGMTNVTATYDGIDGTSAVTATSPVMFIAECGNGLAVDVFDAYASGNVAPLRVISGAATTFSGLVWQTQVYNDELYVSYSGGIAVFPVTASGNVAPTRVITGAATLLSNAFGMVIFNNEIFVSSNSKILVFPATSMGNVAPIRTIAGPTTNLSNNIFGLAVLDNELYVSNYDKAAVQVFPLMANGDLAPTRAITGPHTLLGVNYDIRIIAGEVYVHTLSGIRVFLPTQTGDVSPIRSISGPDTQIATAIGLNVLGNELYSVNVAPPVGVFVFPNSATEDAVPVRSMTGAMTTLANPRTVTFY